MLPASDPVKYSRCLLTILLLSRLALPQALSSQPSRTAADATPQTSAALPGPPLASFKDISEKAGINFELVSGEKNVKKYIIETTGPGVAIFDYDNDDWPDIFFVNGTRLGNLPKG